MNQNADSKDKHQCITGIPGIDGQHNDLFKNVTALLDYLKKGKTASDSIRELLGKIKESLKSHFETEESLMEMIGFPKVVNHKKQHEMLYKQISDIADAFEKDNGVNIADAVIALNDAKLEHSAVSDVEYVAHIEKLMELRQQFNITAVKAQILTR